MLTPTDFVIVVYVGGRGERMMPLTRATNKVLLNYNGSAIISHVLKPFFELGFKQFCFLVGHMKSFVIDAIDEIKPSNATFNYLDTELNLSQGIVEASKLYPGKKISSLHGNIILPKNQIEKFFSSYDQATDFHLMVSERKFNDHHGHPYIYLSNNGVYQCNIGLIPLGFCVLGLNIHSKNAIKSLSATPDCKIPEQIIGHKNLRINLHSVEFTMKHFEKPSDLKN